jgi:predicted acyltransferase
VWVLNPYAAALLLPAAHAWLLVSAPSGPSRRSLALAGVLGGLLLPVLLVVYYVQSWGLGPMEAVWTLFNLVAGGVLGVLDAVALTGFFAALCATVAILRARGRLRRSATVQEDKLVTRGPRSYAGPGSLGGTESALRR